MAVPAVRAEKAYEKHAWIIFLALGIIFLGQATVALVTRRPPDVFVQGSIGMTWSELVTTNPRIASFISHLITGEGVRGALASILTIAMSWKSYRRGEIWSWFAFWILPILFGLAAIISTPDNLLYAIVALLGLLLPYRKFFPRKQA